MSVPRLRRLWTTLFEAKNDLLWKQPVVDDGRMTKAGALGLKLRVLLFAASPTFNSEYLWHPAANEYTCYMNYDRERWKRAVDAGDEFLAEYRAHGEYDLTRATAFHFWDVRMTVAN
jgi:hypothetical protein